MQGLFVNIYFRILQAGADPMIAQILQHIQRGDDVWAMLPYDIPRKIKAHGNEITTKGQSLINNKNT